MSFLRVVYKHLVFTNDYSTHLTFEMLKGKALLASRMWPNMPNRKA